MQEDIEMTPSTSSTRKRGADLLVDPDDGAEISSSKKSRVKPDTTRKVNCLRFIIRSYEAIHNRMVSKVDPNFSNINIANQITNIIFSAFTILRQRPGGTTGNTERKATEKKQYTITSKGVAYTIPFDDALKIVEDSAKENNLEFKRYGPRDPENWYLNAAPYLDFFDTNQLRFIELRIGHNLMPICKIGDQVKSFPVDKYGFNRSHHILLEGCTYPPEKRSSMAQSLGPGTVMLLHIRTEERYRKKWTDAAKRAMAFVPMIDEILDVVKGKRAIEIRGLLGTLNDLLLITSGRQAHRMFFPVNMLYKVLSLRLNDGDIVLDVKGNPTGLIGGNTFLQHFKVTGNGGFYCYMLCQGIQFEYEGNFTETEAQQILFHTIFGTYKEDLSILEQITALGNWSTREEMGKSFQRMTTGGASVSFRPVKLLKYYKLTCANQSSLFATTEATTYLQQSSIPVFSGFRRQHFRDEFFGQLGKWTGTSAVAKTIPQITSALTECLSIARKKLLDGKRMERGTVEWRKVSGMHPEEGGAVLNEHLVGTGKFF